MTAGFRLLFVYVGCKTESLWALRGVSCSTLPEPMSVGVMVLGLGFRVWD